MNRTAYIDSIARAADLQQSPQAMRAAQAALWKRHGLNSWIGARVGTVERFIEGKGSHLCANDPRAADLIAVRMDHPQVNKRTYRFIFDDCKILEGNT